MQIGYHSICWGGVVGAPSGVTSLKDLYYRIGGSIEKALRDIADTGYRGVEVFDGDLVASGAGAPWWSAQLKATGLELVSVYCGANFVYEEALPDELSRIEVVAKAAAQLGARQLVVGGGARRSTGTPATDYQRLAHGLDAVAELAERQGLRASYHPHLGTMAETPEEIDLVFQRSTIAFCPDTAHLAAGGGDPAALMRRYADRIAHVHLKDLGTDGTTFLPLGVGKLDFASVCSALLTARFEGWAMVELDTFDGDPRDAARASRHYLDALLANSAECAETAEDSRA